MCLRLTSTNQEETTIRGLHVLEVERELFFYLHLQSIESFGLEVVAEDVFGVSLKEKHLAKLSTVIDGSSVASWLNLLDLLILDRILLKSKKLLFLFRCTTSISVLLSLSFDLQYVIVSL
jgi:hypothetical protein